MPYNTYGPPTARITTTDIAVVNSSKRLACPKCGNRKQSLHTVGHNNSPAFKCTECGVYYLSQVTTEMYGCMVVTNYDNCVGRGLRELTQ